VGFICPELNKPFGGRYWQLSIRAAHAAQQAASEDDSQHHTVRAACGALVDAKGRNVEHPHAGAKGAASKPARCGSDNAQPQSESAKVPEPAKAAASASSLKDSFPALNAGRAQHQPTQSTDDSDGSVWLTGGSAVRVGAALLTSGGVVWALRSTFWAYLLVFGLPLWRDVDLLPIVVRGEGEGGVVDDTRPSTAAERAVTDVLHAATSPLGDRRRRR
jgi:hypothetical protein